MSIKRRATTELNHENWDKEDPSDVEQVGPFQTASKDEMQKRVIRTAKRRSQLSSGDSVNKGAFGGFSGFQKKAPSSFDFLANLTNGNKAASPAATSETPVSSSLFTSKPLASSTLQSIPTSSENAKSSSESPNKPNPIFGGLSSTPLSTTSKATTLGESPFKIQSSNATTTGFTGFNFKASTASTPASTPQMTSNTTQPSKEKSLFSGTSAKATTSAPTSIFGNKPTDKKEDDNDPKKLNYYAKLKGLNESVSDWIKKHVEATPLCILTPIFQDYEKHLKEIQDEYNPKESKSTLSSKEETKTNGESSQASSLFAANTKSSPFSLKSNTTNALASSPSMVPAASATTSPSTGFSFGIKPATTTPASTSGSFSFGTSTTNSGTNGGQFSFGTGKPFSFSPNTQKPAETTEESAEPENDEPPKVEFTPVVENDSVYDKRCKVFIKKDENFVDKGVGTLYLKKLDSGKYQLLVRADTNLGNVLLNMILASAIPTQRMGKNNVMLVCIPTPEAKPPPVPILIRVKTSEDADELLETLNKYKA